MRFLRWMYEKIHKRPAPYYYHYPLWRALTKPFRKWIVNSLAPFSPFNCVRIFLYRLCGFKIGKKTFIGMRCYLDDHCYDKMTIGSHVVISYGVFFASHGYEQGHYPIVIEDGAYVGMRASIIGNNKNGKEEGVRIGKGAVVGACTLVNCDVPDGATAVGVPCRILDRPADAKAESEKAEAELSLSV